MLNFSLFGINFKLGAQSPINANYFQLRNISYHFLAMEKTQYVWAQHLDDHN